MGWARALERHWMLPRHRWREVSLASGCARFPGSAWPAAALAFLASGMACYGLYCLIEARHRDLTPDR